MFYTLDLVRSDLNDHGPTHFKSNEIIHRIKFSIVKDEIKKKKNQRTR